jgi:hypothetical protein
VGGGIRNTGTAAGAGGVSGRRGIRGAGGAGFGSGASRGLARCADARERLTALRSTGSGARSGLVSGDACSLGSGTGAIESSRSLTSNRSAYFSVRYSSEATSPIRISPQLAHLFSPLIGEPQFGHVSGSAYLCIETSVLASLSDLPAPRRTTDTPMPTAPYT